MFVIRLVKEYIFPIRSLRRKILENTFRADAVLQAELLPELRSHLVATLPDLQGDDFARHVP